MQLELGQWSEDADAGLDARDDARDEDVHFGREIAAEVDRAGRIDVEAAAHERVGADDAVERAGDEEALTGILYRYRSPRTRRLMSPSPIGVPVETWNVLACQPQRIRHVHGDVDPHPIPRAERGHRVHLGDRRLLRGAWLEQGALQHSSTFNSPAVIVRSPVTRGSS